MKATLSLLREHCEPGGPGSWHSLGENEGRTKSRGREGGRERKGHQVLDGETENRNDRGVG